MTGPEAHVSHNPERSIRLAVPGDAAAIAAILREVGWFDHINREESARSEARAKRGLEVCEGDENQTVLVATVAASTMLHVMLNCSEASVSTTTDSSQARKATGALYPPVSL